MFDFGGMVVAWTSARRNLLLYKLINQRLWYLAKVTIFPFPFQVQDNTFCFGGVPYAAN